jgi:hypothetical protein
LWKISFNLKDEQQREWQNALRWRRKTKTCEEAQNQRNVEMRETEVPCEENMGKIC